MTTIYYFTSTGNSLYAAKRITEEIGGTVLPMRDKPAICEDDVIGFVFPVYFWNLPRIVTRFVSELQIKNKNAYIFAVLSAGGPGFGVLGVLKKQLRAKGITLHYGKRLIAISNYLPEFNINDSMDRWKKTEKNLRTIIKEIKNKKYRRIGTFTALNDLAFKLCPGQESDRYFSVSDKCTGCGTCEKVCPVNNIVIESEKPSFQHQCEHCLGCLHNCPATAIDWKDKTQGKKRYRNPEVTLHELITFNNPGSEN